MVRRIDFNGQAKAIANLTVQTLTWTASEIASERVVAYHVMLINNDLSDVTRIRLSANGSNIINITPLQLRAYWQAFTGGKVKIGATATAFSIPLAMLDAPTPDLQDVSQFPMRSQVQLEIVLAATAVTGSGIVSWTETSIAPEIFPRILGSAMNIPASVALQRFNFQENGVIRGIGLTHTGIDRAKIALGNEEFVLSPSEEFLGVAATPDLLLEAEVLYGNGISSAGTPLVTDAFTRLTAGIPAPVDGSFIELQTGATWGGVGNEAAIYAVAPNGVQAA